MNGTPTLACAVLLLPALLSAQGSLTTTFASNSGGANGGVVYFDLDVTDPAGVQIHQLDIHTPSPFGGVTFYSTPTSWVGNNSNPSAWTPRATGSFAVGAGIGAPTQVCLGNGFHLPQGQWGVAVAQDLSTTQAYTVGTGGVPLVYATSELTLTAGAASNNQFAGPVFVPRVWNGTIYYNIGTTPGACLPSATKEQYGTGCLADFASFYEQMTSAAFDLSNTDIVGTATSNGYSVQVMPGTGPLPVGGVGGATVLTLGDDNQVAAGTLGMSVGSNGWFARGAGNSNGFIPLAAQLLGNPAEAIYTWTDLQPNTSGVVTYEEDVVSGMTRVTFDGVYGWNTNDPVFVQMDFDVGTGDWAIRFGTVGFANPEDWLVGYSPAGVSADPGSVDVSAGSIATAAVDVLPLTVDGDTPNLGGSWNITTDNIDPASPFAVAFFGVRGAPVPMAAIGLDAPECVVHLGSVMSNLVASSVANSATVSVAVPAATALVGVQLAEQSVCLTLQNPAGLLTSNGIEGTVGL